MAGEIGKLGLPMKLEDALRRAGVALVGDAACKSEKELLGLPRIGEVSVALIREKLNELGLDFDETLDYQPIPSDRGEEPQNQEEA